MKVAITAANGQLGTEVVTAVLGLIPSANVVGLARTPDKAKHLGIEIRPGDYNEKDVLEESLQSVDAVLLVSGMDAPEWRIKQHRNVIEAARSAGVKKIVYTSVQGAEEATAFSPIIQSNRQTEEDVRRSGLAWVIGRNGIYIEPDVEYLETYKMSGGITNCAGDGRCGYVTRPELAYAYARLLTEEKPQRPHLQPARRGHHSIRACGLPQQRIRHRSDLHPDDRRGIPRRIGSPSWVNSWVRSSPVSMRAFETEKLTTPATIPRPQAEST